MIKELEYKDFLTNELLNKRFKNQFDLVRHAIYLAEQTITRGGSLPTAGESENLAFQVLAAIAEDKDSVSNIIPAAPVPEETMEFQKRTPKNSKEGRSEGKKRQSKVSDWDDIL